MKKFGKMFTTLFILFLLFSCATLEIPKPKNNEDTIVVIPKLIVDVQSAWVEPKYLIFMILEHIETGEKKDIFLSDASKDYQFSNRLPPGKYLIKEFRRGKWKSKDTFSKLLNVEAGKMTIFPYKVVFLIDDRHWYTIFPEIHKKELDRIIAVLSEKDNFNSWQLTE